MVHSINLVAEDLARQVKNHRDKRRSRRDRATRRAGAQHRLKTAPERPARPCYRLNMTILDRALRVGEWKKFKTFEKNVARINDFETELELESDDELRARVLRAARAPPARRVARRPAVRGVRAHPRGGQAHHRAAPLRRSADRRHGAPRRLDRRDEDGRGQDAHRHPAVVLNALASRDENGYPAEGKGIHLVTVNDYLARRDAEWMTPDLRAAGRDRRDHPVRAERDRQAGGLLPRRRVRHQLRVRLRLPARQPRGGDRAQGPARPRLRDRGRGRQHPHRRGAHPADHLGPARAGGRPLLQVRRAGQDDGAGQEARGHRVQVQGVGGRLRLRARREAQDRVGHRARRGQGRALPRHRQPLPGRARQPGQPPPAGAEGRVALQARRGLRGDRRRGEDHRRVHRPHPGGPPLVGGAAPGGGGQGGRGDPGGEPDGRHDHLPELLPPLRQARRA